MSKVKKHSRKSSKVGPEAAEPPVARKVEEPVRVPDENPADLACGICSRTYELPS
jgi:hypothetical protein